MSKYTHINVFTPHTQAFTSNIHLRQPAREKDNRLFIRLGGWSDDEIQKVINPEGSLVYDVPIHAKQDVSEGDEVATVLIDKYEDTGNSHKTELYKVHAYDGVTKIDEKEINDDRTGTKTEEYYHETHNLNARASY